MNIQISNVAIRQTENQLFNLNDLHLASGGQKQHQPSNWLRNAQTKEVISELEAQGCIATEVINGGKNRGTYVCKELVIHYGMWISAKFSLEVIRTFLEVKEAEQAADRLTDEQVGYLYNQVMRICGETGQAYQTVFGGLKRHFQVASYKHIKASDFAQACKWLGVPLPMEKDEKLSKSFDGVDDETLISIGRVLLHAQDMRQFVSRYLVAFENLGIDNKGALWSYVHDTEPAFEHVRRFFTARCPALGHWAWDSNLDWIHRRILSTVDI